jgi:CRP/FNR family transcriptional regulator, nitrogen oxide reductase regulator
VALGKVKLLRPTAEGRRLLLEILTGGSVFGTIPQLGGATYTDGAEAQTECCVLTIGATVFQGMLNRYPAVTTAALSLAGQRIRALQQMVEQLSGNPVEERIASVLVGLAEKFGEENGSATLIQMPLSREDLAAMAGSTPETASRVMSRFRKQGLIECGRRWTAILDLDRLRQLTSHR